ncbi:MAG: hypothetical protein ACTMKV_08940 [Sphingomonas parapaucimobilis]
MVADIRRSPLGLRHAIVATFMRRRGRLPCLGATHPPAPIFIGDFAVYPGLSIRRGAPLVQAPRHSSQ